MATKAKKTTKATTSASTKVTRIKATDETAPKAVKSKAKTVKAKSTKNTSGFLKPFIAIGGYFKGSWYELRQVRWPNRSATWSLTGAVLLFTAFFIVLILLLDVLFKYVFELILK